MKRGGLGGAVLLAAAAAIAVLFLDRPAPSPRAPVVAAPPGAPATEPEPPVPPEPPDTAPPGADAAKAHARLFGRVTDEEGNPIAGAELVLAERHLGGEVVARAGDDGKYLAEGVEGKDLLVGAVAKGYAPSGLHPIGDAERPAYEIDFTLRRGGGSLSLVIRTGDGGDPPARVIIEPFFTEELEPVWDDEEALVPLPGGHRVLGAQGTAAVEGLVPEWNRVRVYAPGYAPVFLPVRLHPGGPVEVTVPLTAGATLVGTVRSPDGAPVPDARVSSVAWQWRCSTRAGPDGIYRIEHLPTGRVEMEAEGGGGNTRAFLDLEDGKESRWDPVLQPTAVISGRVVEEDGSPVAGARMSCSFSGRNESAGWEGVETGPDGTFRFEGCRDAAHVVAVWRPGARGRVPTTEVTANPFDSPLTITLRRGEGFVRGTVVDRNGAPAAGATIRVWPATRPDREVRARAAADGSFRLGPFPPGTYLVELHLDGEPTLHLRPPIDVVAGETLDLGVVRFPPGGRIRARVLEETVPVFVRSLDGSITYAGESDGDAFLSEELAPGSYLVCAPTWGLFEEVSVAGGAVVPVDLRRRPGGKLEVMTVSVGGQPTEARLRVEDLKGRVLRDYDFRATFYLAEGDYRVRAIDDRGRRGEGAVRVGREDLHLVLVLE